MAQRQILRARGRANRIGLDEAEPVERALESRGCEKAPRNGEAAQIVDRNDGFPFRSRHYTMTPVMCTWLPVTTIEPPCPLIPSIVLRRLFVTEKDRVMRTPFSQAPAHMLDLHGESAIAEPLLELAIVPRGPDGETPPGVRAVRAAADSFVVVETCVAPTR